MKKIIAIIWFNASWKDTIAEYISKKLWIKIYSISWVIKKEADKQGLQKTRDNLIDIALKMAKKHWKQVLAERLLEEIKNKWIIVWMRVPEQLNYIRDNTESIFIWVRTDLEKRFERMQNRELYWDPNNLDELIKLEKKENNLPNISNTEICLQKCDYIIDNNWNLEELFNQVDEIIKKSEYF
jgi:dephospho-CoA kinase